MVWVSSRKRQLVLVFQDGLAHLRVSTNIDPTYVRKCDQRKLLEVDLE